LAKIIKIKRKQTEDSKNVGKTNEEAQRNVVGMDGERERERDHAKAKDVMFCFSELSECECECDMSFSSRKCYIHGGRKQEGTNIMNPNRSRPEQ